MGCMSGNRTKMYGNVKYFQRCNKNIMQLVTNIGIRCWKHQNNKDSYIRRMTREVKKSLDDPSVKSVHIIAHSYGGYVTSHVVQELCEHKNSYKLNVLTYGSIYVIDPKNIKKIRMKQYMNRGDVSLRCNVMSRTGITWMKKKRAHNVFDEWKIHMDYPLDEVKNNIIKKLNSV